MSETLAAPGAERSAINMNKVGAGVPANTARAASGCGSGQLAYRAIGKTQVSGLAFHVQRVLGNAARVAAQHGVGLRAAIAREQHKGFVGVGQAQRCGHDVDGARVDLDHAIGAPVAHEFVDLINGVFDVFAFDPIDCVDAFTGAAGVHFQSTDIACATQKSGCIRESRCCCNRRRCEGA